MMCGICGCSENENHEIHGVHEHKNEKLIEVQQDLLAKNKEFADQNRRVFLSKRILALNLMSSPGSGKTTLLVKTLRELQETTKMAVIVGDQQTDLDAQQLRAVGNPVVQVNTGQVCHLDGHMLGHALDKIKLQTNSILFIENIGNLICPALFDLGETYRVAILSVTEGDNKPIKYPDIFHIADLLLLTKCDLLPYVDFDVLKCLEYTSRVNPRLETIMVSAKSGAGLNEWYQWLLKKQRALSTEAPRSETITD